MNNTLVKHSAAITISNALTLTQRKVWNMLLFHAYPYLKSRNVHTIPIKTLYGVADNKSQNLGWLRQAFLDLMDFKLEWGVLGGKHRWESFVALSHAAIERGMCEYSFPPPLARELHMPDFYARLNLDVQRDFTKTSAMILWEYFNLMLGGARETVATVGIADLRRLFGFRTEYKDFKNLRRNVLVPALDEINNVADMRARMELVRAGKAVSMVQFQIRRELPHDPLIDRMRNEFGLAEHAIQKALVRFEGRSGRLAEVLDEIAQKVSVGAVKTSLGGYTYKTLQDAPLDQPPKPKVLKGEGREVVSPAEQYKQQQEQYQRYCDRTLNERFEALSAQDRDALVARVVPGLLADDPIFKRFWNKEGLTHPVCRARVLNTIQIELLGNDWPDFETWRRNTATTEGG